MIDYIYVQLYIDIYIYKYIYIHRNKIYCLKEKAEKK